MKKSDIGVVAFMYAVAGLFLYMTFGLKKEAQIYPLFIISLLLFLTTLYAVKMFKSYKKEGVKNDFHEIFEGFLKNQFFTVLLFSVGYLVLIYLIGFYIASLIYLVATLWFLKVPKMHILLTTIGLSIIVYGAFSLFLRVPLPVGLLFK